MSAHKVTLEVRLCTPTDSDKSHLDKLEKLVRQLSKAHKLDLGIPSASCPTNVTIDSCFLIAKCEADVDLVADDLAAKLSKWHVSDDVTIDFYKRTGGESPEEFVRRVLPTPDPGWIDFMKYLRQIKHGNDTTEDWPVRIRYLAEIASRYYAWGGNDVVSVFSNTKDLHDFVEGLSPGEMTDLVSVANSVIANADHVYIMDWFMDAEEPDWPRCKALYFLALLERLREEGVLTASPKIRSYIDWNRLSG